MTTQAASTVFAVAGAVFFSIQLIPQIVLNYRRHHATGLNASMMLLWACAGVPLGVYNISRNLPVALQVQAQILTLLSLVTYAQCLWYNARWGMTRVLGVTVGLGVLFAGLEVGLVFALKAASDLDWPHLLMAALSALLLGLGVGRHYVDIWQHRTVRGISFLFVGIDAAGDLTSLLSIVLRPGDELDIPGIVIYGVELTMWIGIMLCGVCMGRDRDGGGDEQEDVELEESEVQTSTGVSSAPRAGSVRSRVSARSSPSSHMTVFRTASLAE